MLRVRLVALALAIALAVAVSVVMTKVVYATTPNPILAKCDFDKDGKLTIKDVIHLLRVIVGLEKPTAYCDLNGNDRPNDIGDAVLLLRYVVLGHF